MVCLPLEPSSPVPLPFRSVRIGMADHGVMGRSAGPGARAMRSWCSQCAGIAAPRASRASVGPRRSMRSERDTRRRGRDASETGAVDKLARSPPRGVANRRSEGIVVKRATRAGQPILDRIGTARCAAAAQAMRRHRRARQRAVPMPQSRRRLSRDGRCVASVTRAGVAAMRARRCDGVTDRSRHRRGVAGSGNATALPWRERAVPILRQGSTASISIRRAVSVHEMIS